MISFNLLSYSYGAITVNSLVVKQYSVFVKYLLSFIEIAQGFYSIERD